MIEMVWIDNKKVVIGECSRAAIRRSSARLRSVPGNQVKISLELGCYSKWGQAISVLD
jgi:hypothetical protein